MQGRVARAGKPLRSACRRACSVLRPGVVPHASLEPAARPGSLTCRSHRGAAAACGACSSVPRSNSASVPPEAGPPTACVKVSFVPVGVRALLPGERAREATLAEALHLVREQPARPDLRLEPACPVREREAAAEVEAETGLGVAAVMARPDLQRRGELRRRTEVHRPARFQPEAEPRHFRLRLRQIAARPTGPEHRIRRRLHDRPCATVVECERRDLGDEPPRGLGAVAPPAVRTSPHDVVAVQEHCGRYAADELDRRRRREL